MVVHFEADNTFTQNSDDGLKPDPWLAVQASDLAGWASGLAGWPRGGDESTNKQTNVCSENLPILQDLVPYRGRCSKSQIHGQTDHQKDGWMEKQKDGLTD